MRLIQSELQKVKQIKIRNMVIKRIKLELIKRIKLELIKHMIKLMVKQFIKQVSERLIFILERILRFQLIFIMEYIRWCIWFLERIQ